MNIKKIAVGVLPAVSLVFFAHSIYALEPVAGAYTKQIVDVKNEMKMEGFSATTEVKGNVHVTGGQTYFPANSMGVLPEATADLSKTTFVTYTLTANLGTPSATCQIISQNGPITYDASTGKYSALNIVSYSSQDTTTNYKLIGGGGMTCGGALPNDGYCQETFESATPPTLENPWVSAVTLVISPN